VAKGPNPIDKSLGGRLRERRLAVGWSKEQLAERSELDARDINAFEKGAKRIPADSLLALSNAMGVPPAYFFGFDEGQLSAQREASFSNLPQQGLRLNRAFAGVKSPALREAIVSLVIEIAKNDDPA
jgi:transcriptional regulator with XRE-family HTH domain